MSQCLGLSLDLSFGQRLRAAASDGAAELPPPPPLASERFEHEPQVLDEPRSRKAEEK